jgi:hypothetical protein
MTLVFTISPIVGASTWIELRRAIIRHEVRRHIIQPADRSGLVLLQFSKPETEALLRWEHSSEFEFNGQMYDIVESWVDGDTVYYRCWWDKAETRLNGILRALARRAFRAAPKLNDDEDVNGPLPETRDFLVARPWKLSADLPPLFLSWGKTTGMRPSRSIRPPTPPPWPV